MARPTRVMTKLTVIFAVSLVSCRGDMISSMSGKSVEQFKNLLSQSNLAKQYLSNELTIFAPSDNAMNKYNGLKDDQFILNHMVNVVVQMQERASSYYSDVTRVSSLLPGSPPLWMTKQNSDYFVGGAKIIMRNLQAQSKTGRKQRLHIIDNVLVPLTPKQNDNSQLYIDLTAGKFLRESESYRIPQYSVRNFSSQVRSMNQFNLFDQPGRHTFFIPIDSAFEDLEKKLVDKDIIAGHIVPNKLLFTDPIINQPQRTSTYDRKNIKVTAEIEPNFKVRSSTVQGSRNHPRKNVKANIVRANIPVANGVVHLIDKPLIIVATPLWDYLRGEKEKNGRLSKFANYIQQFGAGLDTVVASAESGTIFAPNNEAFDKLSQSELEILLGKDGRRIMGLHFVDQLIPAEDVRILQPQNDIKMFGAKLPFPSGSRDHLWFYYTNNNRTFMLDGQGVTAEVVEPDIGATNGVIHVIDRILGVPQHTIGEKLAMDPMLSSVHSLGNQNHFNHMFNKTNEAFTYIVPSNGAWEQINRQFASAYKILFMGAFAYQTQSILERHLKIGEKLTAKDLVNKTNEEGQVSMLRGSPGFRFVELKDENGNYTAIQWENLEARLIRADLECTNGYIHVIDRVIMKKRDISISKSSANFASTISLVTATILYMILH